VGCLSAGDTLVVKSGVYDEIVNSFPSGSPGNPVTVKSEVQYGAVLQPSDFGSTVAIVDFVSVHDIVFDGFVVDGGNQTAAITVVKVEIGAHDITIKNCEVKNAIDTHQASSGQGIWTDYDAYNLLISHNKIHDIGAVDGVNRGGSYGMYYHAFNSIVEYNEIYHNSGYGIHMYQCCPSANGGNGNTFRNNLIYDNGRSGMLFASGGYSNIAYNNIIYSNGITAGDGDTGIIVGGYGTPSTNNKVYNNTIYNNAGPGIVLGSPYSGPSNTIVQNNILYQNATDSVMQANDSGSVIDHNLIGTDPRFVNAVGADFHLQASSPAIDAGVMMPGLAYTGATPDLGALESGASAQLPAPTNLRLVGN